MCDVKITGLRLCIHFNECMRKCILTYHSSSNIVIIQMIIFRILKPFSFYFKVINFANLQFATYSIRVMYNAILLPNKHHL